MANSIFKVISSLLIEEVCFRVSHGSSENKKIYFCLRIVLPLCKRLQQGQLGSKPGQRKESPPPPPRQAVHLL